MSRLAILRHDRSYGAETAASWRRLRERLARYASTTPPWRIVEIGSGEFYPYATLFAAEGHCVVGSDVGVLQWAGASRARYARFAAESGSIRACARFAFDLCRQSVYYRALTRSAGLKKPAPRPHLVQGDAERMAFRDSTFDVCLSSAAFEHIGDVPAAVEEMARVLRPGGVADVEIHLFASMTGGHEFELFDRAAPRPDFPLWGHLLHASWRAPVPLNRWRDRQYQAAFARHFDIIDRVVVSTYGDHYLTDSVSARLPEFSREELLTESVVYVLRKRAVSPR